jgi:hypothetical protein
MPSSQSASELHGPGTHALNSISSHMKSGGGSHSGSSEEHAKPQPLAPTTSHT